MLEPDVATLISRGDSLVLEVQKVDLERALTINSTTGELRVARTALKASNEVKTIHFSIITILLSFPLSFIKKK